MVDEANNPSFDDGEVADSFYDSSPDSPSNEVAVTDKEGEKPANATVVNEAAVNETTADGSSEVAVNEPAVDEPPHYPTPQDDVIAAHDSSGQDVGFSHGNVNPVTATDTQLEQANVDKSDAERIAELPPRKVYNPNAGLRPRVGGPYLDNLELEDAEKRRAVLEGREPDYTNMAGSAGVPLVTSAELANMVGGGNPAVADFIDDNADNDQLGPTPLGEVAFHGTNIDVVEASLDENRARREFDNTKVSSHDQPGVVFTSPVSSKTDTLPDE